MRLDGKVAFITGGAGSMGSTEARLFAKEGARVVIADLVEDDGRRVEAEIREAGGEALFVRMDVTSEDDWRNAVERCVARFGKLDVLVNNAGINASSVTGTAPDLLDTEAWDQLMAVNARGVFLGVKYAIQEMRKVGGGSIVNISSTAGLVGTPSGHHGYNASKGAVRLLTKSTAVQYAKEGIRVNSVHPGVMPPMRSGTPGGAERYHSARNEVAASAPMGRQGRAEEVAYAVLFLASDEASFITGAELPVDGGFTAQ